MAYTSADLANIKSAIAGGVQQAVIQGEMVQYRSLAEMIRIKNLIEAEAAPAARPVALCYPVTSRGL